MVKNINVVLPGRALAMGSASAITSGIGKWHPVIRNAGVSD